MKEYFVLFGNESYYPDLHYNVCKHKFDKLKDARAYAKEYSNACIFRMYDNGYIKELKTY